MSIRNVPEDWERSPTASRRPGSEICSTSALRVLSAALAIIAADQGNPDQSFVHVLEWTRKPAEAFGGAPNSCSTVVSRLPSVDCR